MIHYSPAKIKWVSPKIGQTFKKSDVPLHFVLPHAGILK